MEVSKSDWKLFRARIGDWQEAYMERLVKEYVDLLDGAENASDKFWKLEERIKKEKKHPGVMLEERFAVIDDELVWHGGMNLLGKVDIWDNLMRIKNHHVAAELLEISLGSTTESEGG